MDLGLLIFGSSLGHAGRSCKLRCPVARETCADWFNGSQEVEALQTQNHP